jgi:beta-glucosidase
MSLMLEQDFSLSVVARIDKRPKKSVDLKMDCGYPCGGSLNMTKLFKAVPQEQWFRMSFKLSCFKDAGANMTNIFSPLVIMTKGKFEISISEVSLLKTPPPESLVDCG